LSVIENLIGAEYEIEYTGERWAKTREHDSLVIDRKKQIFFWNSMGVVGDAYTWLHVIKGFSPEDARKALEKFGQETGPFIFRVAKLLEPVTVYEKLVDVFYENGKTERAYWYARLINDKTVDRFKLGFTGGWYTVPIYMDGKLKNIQMRRDKPEKRLKVWYKGTGTHLFNTEIMKVTDTIIITEGPTDCLVLNQEGIPSVCNTGGSGNWNIEWYKYFMHQRRIFVVYDNDPAGIHGIGRVMKNLGTERCKGYTFKGFGENYDVCDFFKDKHTSQEFMELVLKESKHLYELGD